MQEEIKQLKHEVDEKNQVITKSFACRTKELAEKKMAEKEKDYLQIELNAEKQKVEANEIEIKKLIPYCLKNIAYLNNNYKYLLDRL